MLYNFITQKTTTHAYFIDLKITRSTFVGESSKDCSEDWGAERFRTRISSFIHFHWVNIFTDFLESSKEWPKNQTRLLQGKNKGVRRPDVEVKDPYLYACTYAYAWRLKTLTLEKAGRMQRKKQREGIFTSLLIWIFFVYLCLAKSRS